MSINISDIIPIIIVFQSLLFVVVLISDKGPKKISNRYLASFLILLGIQFFTIAANSMGLKSEFIFLIACIYGYGYGPLLYLYTKTLIYKSFDFQVIQLLHFIPIALTMVFTAFGFSVCGTFGYLLYLSLITYIILAIKEMVNYRKVIRETQSSTDQRDLQWLQWTMIIFCVALILDLADQFLWRMNILGDISSVHLTLALLINWMYYKGLKQPQIFQGITSLDEEVYKDKKNSPSQKLPDTDEQLELDHIQKFMTENDIYTNPQLNLKELSGHLNISPRRLSYLINTFLNQNFMGFVNDFRIEKAKSLLSTHREQGETVMEIMYEVGFNSKSSFFTIFKQKTGVTPTEFKNKYDFKRV